MRCFQISGIRLTNSNAAPLSEPAAHGRAPAPARKPPTPPTRQALHEALLASDSATSVLERFYPPPIHVRRLPAADHGMPLDPRRREALQVALPGDILHRRVNLMSGDMVLSEADIWFVPARLTPGMLHALATTQTPFGHIVRPLALRRVRLAARLCDAGEPAALEHRARLIAPCGHAVAEVWERYGWAMFASP